MARTSRSWTGRSGFLPTFSNDLSTTGFGNARFTLNNSNAVALDVCIDGVKVAALTDIGVGHSNEVEMPQEIDAELNVVPDPAPCTFNTPNATPLAAGTNLVVTATDVTACTTGCAQLIVVGQDRPQNNPNTAAFCSALTALQNIQAEIKGVLGGVNPADSSTFPSAPAVNQLVTDINSAVNAGDAVVPTTVMPQWEIVTSGLRQLATGLTSASYRLANIPEASLDTIIDGINSTAPPSGATAAATTVLTSFFETSCITTTVSPLFTG